MAEARNTFNPSWKLKSIFSVLGLLNLVAALDATSVAAALPTVTAALNGTAVEAFWAGTCFLITSAVFQPVFSLAAEIYGRKASLFSAELLFALGSSLAALSHGFNLFLTGRCIQGIGCGGITALTEILITDLIPLHERGKWLSIRSGTWALGSVLGPIIGGAFAQSSSWRWVFWINVPICVLGLGLIPFFLRLENIRPSRMELSDVDYIGISLFMASLSSFLISISCGGIVYPWMSWHTLVPLLVGLVGLLAFAIYERCVPFQPFLPPGIFANRTVVINFIGCFLHGFILWALVYYLPLYYQAVLDYSPFISGLAVFPECLTVPPVSVATGFAIANTAEFRWALWTGWSITCFGTGLLALLDISTPIPKWIFINLIPGIGTGMVFSAPMLTIQAAANPDYLAISVAMAAFFRTVGQAVGVAGGGVVFQNRIRAEFKSNAMISGTAERFAREAAGLVQYLKGLPAGEEKFAMQVAYANALATLWLVLCAVAGLALVLSLLTRKYSMHQVFAATQAIQGMELEQMPRRDGEAERA